MKKYKLECPMCGAPESVAAYTHNPAKLYCFSCEEDISIESIKEFIFAWGEYIKDLENIK